MSLNVGKVSKRVEIPAQWSRTGLRCLVLVIKYENQQYLVRYSDGYEEWLPWHVFA